MARKRRRQTDITLWDHLRLQMMLESSPDKVLKLFKRAQVGCLMELECFRRIRETAPDIARRIAAVALSMGIPEEQSI